MIKAFVFDLDGTTANTEEGVLNGFRRAFETVGVPMPDAEMCGRFMGPPLAYSFRELMGLSEADTARAIAAYREWYTQTGIFECYIYEGLPELMRELRRRGKQVLVGTSKPEEFAHRIVTHFGMDDCFDYVAGSTFDGSRDKKAEVLAYALKAQGLQPEEALMIGDRNLDVLGARAVGMDCVGILYGFGDEPELRAAGARYIARDVPALAELLLSL